MTGFPFCLVKIIIVWRDLLFYSCPAFLSCHKKAIRRFWCHWLVVQYNKHLKGKYIFTTLSYLIYIFVHAIEIITHKKIISSAIFNTIAGFVSENRHHYGYESTRDHLFMYIMSFLWGLGSAMLTSLACSSPQRGVPATLQLYCGWWDCGATGPRDWGLREFQTSSIINECLSSKCHSTYY